MNSGYVRSVRCAVKSIKGIIASKRVCYFFVVNNYTFPIILTIDCSMIWKYDIFSGNAYVWEYLGIKRRWQSMNKNAAKKLEECYNSGLTKTEIMIGETKYEVSLEEFTIKNNDENCSYKASERHSAKILLLLRPYLIIFLFSWGWKIS